MTDKHHALDAAEVKLERARRRRMMYAMMASSVALGRFFNKFGMHGGEHRMIRNFTNLISRKMYAIRVPGIVHVKTTICGVPVRIYRQQHHDNTSSSATTKPGPVLIYVHGGGWVMCDTKLYHGLTQELCRDIGATVVSLEYRLAPEHPYPAGLDDCLAVTRAILHADTEPNKLPPELRGLVDVNRVGMAGDSAGGNLTGAVALDMIRSNDDRRLRAVMPISGVFQAVTQGFESYKKLDKYRSSFNLMSWVLPRYAGIEATKAQMGLIGRDGHVAEAERKKLIEKYLTSPTDVKLEPNWKLFRKSNGNRVHLPKSVGELATCVRAWPLLAEDSELAQMPVTNVQICSEDPLCDEEFVFVERMRHAGAKDVRVSYIDRADHAEAFIGKLIRSEIGKVAYKEIVNFFREVFHERQLQASAEK